MQRFERDAMFGINYWKHKLLMVIWKWFSFTKYFFLLQVVERRLSFMPSQVQL